MARIHIRPLAIGGLLLMAMQGVGAIPFVHAVDETRSFEREGVSGIAVRTGSVPVRISEAAADAKVSLRLTGWIFGALRRSCGFEEGIAFFREEGRGCRLGNLRLEVSIPKGWKGTVDLRTSSGGISLDELMVARFAARTISGNLTLRALRSTDISLESTSGNATLGVVEAARFSFDSTSGNLVADSIDASAFAVKSSSGNRRIARLSADAAGIVLTSGSFSVDACMVRELQAEATSGAVSVGFDRFEAARVAISATTGSVTLSLPRDAEFHLDAQSASGAIRAEFPLSGGAREESHRLEGRVGKGAAEIAVRTTAGAITLAPRY